MGRNEHPQTRKPATEYRIHHRDCSKQNLTTAVGMGMGMGHPDPSRWWTAQRSAGCSAVWSLVVCNRPLPRTVGSCGMDGGFASSTLVHWCGITALIWGLHTHLQQHHIFATALYSMPGNPNLDSPDMPPPLPAMHTPPPFRVAVQGPASRDLDRYLQGRSCLRAAAAWASGSSAVLQVCNSASSQPKTVVARVLLLRLPQFPDARDWRR
jgi:hypothetical protein